MNKRALLILGDVLAIALITGIGFASHRELGTAPFSRILATFVPLAFGWFLIAPWLGLFEGGVAADARQLHLHCDERTPALAGGARGAAQVWRPPLAMLFVAPLAAFLRGASLNSVILPVFVAVLGLSAALVVLAWRGVWLLLNRRK